MSENSGNGHFGGWHDFDPAVPDSADLAEKPARSTVSSDVNADISTQEPTDEADASEES
ncbi:MAG: hypothetical protein JWO67_2690 [Streptosporangiaceae bacterium]|nr:hypothetical protein [Streptosporangiaceae bacterium]